MCKLVHFSDVLKSYIPLTSYARHISWCLRHNSRNGEYKDYELFVTSAYLVSHLKGREAVCQEKFFFSILYIRQAHPMSIYFAVKINWPLQEKFPYLMFCHST